jgi:hypothetical protein
MKKQLILLTFLLFTSPVLSSDFGGHWLLEKSEITYTVSHPLHVVHGKSLTARGKGVCYGGHCEFHIGVLVKSFDSGDNNRDLHMLQITRGGLYPLIDVVAEMAEIHEKVPKQAMADLTIQFAGKTVKYPKVKLDILEWKPDGAHISGTIPLSLKDFEIQPPTLLAMPIKDDVPVKLDMFWKHVDSKLEKQ